MLGLDSTSHFAASGTLQPDCAYQPANPLEVALIRQVQVAVPMTLCLEQLETSIIMSQPFMRSTNGE